MKKIVLYVLLLSVAVSACKPWSNTAKGGAIGAGAGAVLGGVIGNKAGNTAVGAVIGAAVGGAAGVAIGRYMDKQKRELEEDLKKSSGNTADSEVKIERVGEGINVTLGSGILFDVAKYDLKAQAKENLKKVSETLNKYPDTEILVTGHTDSDGSDELNQTLSERRASAVLNYLASVGNVSRNRLKMQGFGESQPLADNTTTAGKAKNRRVEIGIYANEKLKEQAKEGKLD